MLSWQMLFGAFRPQTTKEIKKSQAPSAAEESAVRLDPSPIPKGKPIANHPRYFTRTVGSTDNPGRNK
jgi:hypothetical protein